MKRAIRTHERTSHDAPTLGSSDRSFGVVVTILFGVVGLFPLFVGRAPRWWSLAAAAAVLATALLEPRWLAPFHRIWFRLGLFLHHIVSPVVMAVIYFAVVTPTGLIMRALGKDPLRLRREPDAASYWIHRDPPGPERESMTNQF